MLRVIRQPRSGIDVRNVVVVDCKQRSVNDSGSFDVPAQLNAFATEEVTSRENAQLDVPGADEILERYVVGETLAYTVGICREGNGSYIALALRGEGKYRREE